MIRVGAVSDAQDLNYLLNPHAKNIEDDNKHLQKILPRFRQAINKGGRAMHGLKVIITLTSTKCSISKQIWTKFWESEKVRVHAANFGVDC